jgi:hypothetical protein
MSPTKDKPKNQKSNRFRPFYKFLEKEFFYDSPPLDYAFNENAQMENFADINVLTSILPSLQNLTPHEIMDKLNAYRSTNKAQISKLDKKLYIGKTSFTI